MCELACQIIQKKQEEKRIEEEQAANARYWKIPACIPDTMCDVHLVNNSTPLEAKDHFEIVLNSNDDISSCDNDSLHEENIEYVEASPHDSELVSLEAAEIVIPEVEEIEDDNLREKLFNVHLLIANIEALKDNPTQSSELLTKSSSTSLNSFLKETSTFHNSFLEFKNFYFDLGEISSGSTTTHSDISLPDYEAFYFDEDHISSGSTTTHSDISLSEYDSFIFEEFVDELAHIISPPEISRWRYNLSPAESKFKTPMLDHQDKYMMKAQVHVSKFSAISDIQALPRRKHYCQIYQVVKHKLRGRFLAKLSRSRA
nr:hypothetical protein [Tanacetum cinerariifolium]